MGTTNGDDEAALKKRAEALREAARDARAGARQLGTYLDGAVKKAAPRAGGRSADSGDAMWQGPFADESTQALQDRQRKLAGMANSLMADASRWETAADDLDNQAKAAKAKAHAGGH